MFTYIIIVLISVYARSVGHPTGFQIPFRTQSMVHIYSCTFSTRLYVTGQLSGKLPTIIISAVLPDDIRASHIQLPDKRPVFENMMIISTVETSRELLGKKIITTNTGLLSGKLYTHFWYWLYSKQWNLSSSFLYLFVAQAAVVPQSVRWLCNWWHFIRCHRNRWNFIRCHRNR
jgi:hypothetical protein